MVDTTIADLEIDVETEAVEPTAVDRLADIINADNPVDLLNEDELAAVANDLKDNFDRDLDSMEDWLDLVEKGQELMSQDFEPREQPWDGAANFKSPVIMNAVLAFGDTSSQELLRKSDVVKPMVVGKDPQGVKLQQGERVSEFMNFQINVQMPEWRVEHDKLLYTLPSTGCMFKKTFFDTSLNRNVSDVIFYPNFVVNQANTTIEDAASFTQIMQFTENEVEEKQRMGEWAQINFVVDDDNVENQPEENEDRFLEQHAWWDLDNDGYKEPYVVTMHEGTRSIVKIAPRFVPSNVKVRVFGEVFDPQAQQVISLDGEIITMDVFLALRETNPNLVADEVVSITPINLLTKYDFLPDPKGEFLGLGYPHLLCGVTQAINTTSNHLLDAGTLSNLPGGYLAKGVRKRLGEDRFRPGEWKGTNVPARDFANAFFPLPYSEPSQALFAFNEKMQAEAERTANVADFSKVLANNAPATTTLALLQKETQATTSIIRRIYRSMSEEFEKMAQLNGLFGDPNEYLRVLDDPRANFDADFDTTQLNFVPVSNPEMSSRIERVKSAEVQVGFMPQIEQAGGEVQPVMKNFLEALGTQNIDEIFPQPQPAQIERQTAAMEEQNAQLQFQNSLFDRELAVREQDVQRKIAETQSDIAETRANIIKIESEAILNLEKAETEEQQNQLTTYTAELQFLATTLGKLGGTVENNRPRAGGAGQANS